MSQKGGPVIEAAESPSGRVAVGPPYKIVPAELLVALPHVDLVAGLLGPQTVVDRSNKLGLARLKFGDVDAAISEVVRKAQQERIPISSDVQAADPGINQLIAALHALFRGRYADWTPTIGKNRLVGHVLGAGEVSHGGAGDPRMQDGALPWRGTGPGAGVRVGVLDSGLWPLPWLSGGWVGRYSDQLFGPKPLPAVAGHGTFVAGLVLSQAPGARVEVRRVLDGEGIANSWDVAHAIVEIGSTGIDVLNLSFVCYTEDSQPPLALAHAVDRLDPDVVVIAAAGNHGDLPGSEGRKPSWPAALDDVIAVGALNADGGRATFSPEAPWIDVLAPGEGLVSTFPDTIVTVGSQDIPFQGVAKWQGTSFSSALVTGVIAAATEPGIVSARTAWRDVCTALRGPESVHPTPVLNRIRLLRPLT